jgi:hypothetical protein
MLTTRLSTSRSVKRPVFGFSRALTTRYLSLDKDSRRRIVLGEDNRIDLFRDQLFHDLNRAGSSGLLLTRWHDFYDFVGKHKAASVTSSVDLDHAL